jgi:hypothetical protein
MLFRAVIYDISHGINILWINNKGNWFNFRGRSYRKDMKAVRQVMTKGNQIKGTVEAIYIEGNPIPIFSKLDVKAATKEHWDSMIAKAGNKPQKGFWDMLLGR